MPSAKVMLWRALKGQGQLLPERFFFAKKKSTSEKCGAEELGAENLRAAPHIHELMEKFLPQAFFRL